ncbi:MAG: hypothetical protein JXO22_02485 [Phycisphaerae bacterium]|nr:hypothetical protein [Phycisphaerae bacterium]
MPKDGQVNASDWIEEPGEYESLALSLRAVLNEAGAPREYDEIVAALGLGVAVVSVADECIGWWAAYERDVSLAAAAETYGILLRELHPPAAAIGLADAREFEQHYRDSYVPLIRRALEVGQVCLAWRGWPQPMDRAWGVITEARAAALWGVAPGRSSTLRQIGGAAWQVYIVEKITPQQRDDRLQASALFDQACDAARRFWKPTEQKTRAILTGAAAFDAWADALDRDNPCPRCAEQSYRCQGQLTRVLISSREHLSRWLRRVMPELDSRRQKLAERWVAASEQSADAMSAYQEDARLQRLFATTDGRAVVRQAIERVRDIEAALAVDWE